MSSSSDPTTSNVAVDGTVRYENLTGAKLLAGNTRITFTVDTCKRALAFCATRQISAHSLPSTAQEVMDYMLFIGWVVHNPELFPILAKKIITWTINNVNNTVLQPMLRETQDEPGVNGSSWTCKWVKFTVKWTKPCSPFRIRKDPIFTSDVTVQDMVIRPVVHRDHMTITRLVHACEDRSADNIQEMLATSKASITPAPISSSSAQKVVENEIPTPIAHSVAASSSQVIKTIASPDPPISIKKTGYESAFIAFLTNLVEDPDFCFHLYANSPLTTRMQMEVFLSEFFPKKLIKSAPRAPSSPMISSLEDMIRAIVDANSRKVIYDSGSPSFQEQLAGLVPRFWGGGWWEAAESPSFAYKDKTSNDHVTPSRDGDAMSEVSSATSSHSSDTSIRPAPINPAVIKRGPANPAPVRRTTVNHTVENFMAEKGTPLGYTLKDLMAEKRAATKTKNKTKTKTKTDGKTDANTHIDIDDILKRYEK